jgi:hypothetical protein
MKLRGAGRALIAAGVVSVITYVLISLYGAQPRIGTLLLYVGILMIIIGIAVRLLRNRA